MRPKDRATNTPAVVAASLDQLADELERFGVSVLTPDMLRQIAKRLREQVAA